MHKFVDCANFRLNEQYSRYLFDWYEHVQLLLFDGETVRIYFSNKSINGMINSKVYDRLKSFWHFESNTRRAALKYIITMMRISLLSIVLCVFFYFITKLWILMWVAGQNPAMANWYSISLKMIIFTWKTILAFVAFTHIDVTDAHDLVALIWIAAQLCKGDFQIK